MPEIGPQDQDTRPMRPGHVRADHRNMRSLRAVTLIIVLSLVAACSDDDSSRSSLAYCEDLQALDDGGGGPTDAFFERYGDNPTLDDWAEGLPDIISDGRETREEFASIEASTELEDERSAFLVALDAIVQSFEDSLAAARAGDQAEFDRLEAENQDENVPAMGAAMQALEEACTAAAE